LSRKFTLEEAQQEFISRDYIPLFKTYKDCHEKLLVQTKEGYKVVTCLSNLKNEQIPNKFDKSNLYTIENIKLWCKLNNKEFELISDKYEGNNKKLKWKCLKEDCKEIFEMNWSNIYIGQNCPYCCGVQVGLSNCLATKRPDLAKEWHPTKNGDLTPYDVTCGSHKNVWWLCQKCNYEWQTAICNRNNGSDCPKHKFEKISIANSIPTKDNNLLIMFPDLCKEWNYDKNIKNPEEYCMGSNKKVWWKCEERHEWEAAINNRCNGNNCPYCNGNKVCIDNCLQTINIKLSKEWNFDKNKDLTPYDVMANSNKKVWWKCNICNYEWIAVINNRNRGKGCPKCNESKGESKIKQYLENKNIKYESQYRFILCKNIRPLPFDLYLSKYNVCIEFDSELHYKSIDYFGGELAFKKRQQNDKIKTKYCQDNNILLLRIPYWEFNNIEKILDEFLLSVNNQTNIE
jgi:hypothetical protein